MKILNGLLAMSLVSVILLGDCSKYYDHALLSQKRMQKEEGAEMVSAYAAMGSMSLGFYQKCISEERHKEIVRLLKELNQPKASPTNNNFGTGY